MATSDAPLRARAIQRHALAFAGFLAAMFVLWETIARFIPYVGMLQYDPVLLWTNQRTIGSGINEQGLRGPAVDPEARPDLRILALGCSSTYGLIVPEAAAYPRRLETRLRERLPGRSIEVLNAGVNGYSSYQGVTLLRDLGPLYRPQIVTFMFGHTDKWKSRRYAGGDKSRVMPELTRLERMMRDAPSALLRLNVYPLAAPRRKKNRPPPAGESAMRVPPGEFLDNAEEIARLASAWGGRVIFLTYPAKSLDTEEYDAALREYAPPRREVLVDAAAILRAAGDDAFLLDEYHPSRAGHDLIAAALADAVLELRPDLVPVR
ncbi:SGNH/GDSL hydrolase family protein [bacterium]|nr:SGNH/GDSL hydrolase family protein [bacterium]